MDSTFVIVIAVLLLARIGLRQNVPLVAFYVACVSWTLAILWGPVLGWVEWVLSAFELINRYDAPPMFISLVQATVDAVIELVLVVAVLLAARGTPLGGAVSASPASPAAPATAAPAPAAPATAAPPPPGASASKAEIEPPA